MNSNYYYYYYISKYLLNLNLEMKFSIFNYFFLNSNFLFIINRNIYYRIKLLIFKCKID